MNKNRFILLLGITSVLFFSCKNFFGGNQLKKEYSISGKVLEGDFSKEDADSKRSAFPVSSNNYYYKITATDDSDSEKSVVTESSYLDSSFILKIPYAGVWNITAEGFLDSARTQKLLKTTKTVRVSVSDENPSGYAEILLCPFVSDSGNGGVNLEILLPGTARPIEKIVCECISATKSGAKDVFSTKFSEISALTVSENKAQLNLTGLPSASYTVNFYFYGKVSTEDVLYYCATQILNVYDNFTCTNWVKHGEEEYLVEESESTVFKVTDELTEAFLLSAVYVDGLDGNDSNSGTWIAPVKTLDMAFALYNVSGSKVSTIFVKGDSTNSVVAAQPLTVTKNLSINKNPLAENTPVILFKGEAANPITSSCFTVGSGKTLEVSGIEVKAGENVAIAQNGGAFFVSGNLSLKNITISDFKLSDNTKNGGAIFVNSTGSLSIGGENHISTNKKTALTEGNFVNSNIYLSTGKKINITGDLTGSEIGISLQNENTVTPLVQVVFTQNFSVKNEQSPFRCFVSDTDYIAGYDKDYVAGGTGEAVLAISGGTLGWENTNKNIKIKISDKCIMYGKDTTAIIKVLNESNQFISADDYEISYRFLLNSNDVSDSMYAIGSGDRKNEFTFKNNLYYGKYNLLVSVNYKESIYTADFSIKIQDSFSVSQLTEAPSSGVFSVSEPAELLKVVTWANEGGASFEDVSLVLEEDVDLTTTSFQPIGEEIIYKADGTTKDYFKDLDTFFEGVLDGNGHTLKVKRSKDSWDYRAALVAQNKGTIRNFIIESEKNDNSRNSHYGLIARTNMSEGIIQNIKVTGEYYNVEMTRCGLVAYNHGIIENCVNEANYYIDSKASWAGYYTFASGICSTNLTGGIIRNCVNYGTIKANVYHYASGDLNGIPAPICAEIAPGSYVENCYWLKDSAVYKTSGTEHPMNEVGYRATISSYSYDFILNKSLYTDLAPGTPDGAVTSCGYFETDSITPWHDSVKNSTNELEYGSDLLSALNGYVMAHPDAGLLTWKLDDNEHVTLDFE